MFLFSGEMRGYIPRKTLFKCYGSLLNKIKSLFRAKQFSFISPKKVTECLYKYIKQHSMLLFRTFLHISTTNRSLITKHSNYKLFIISLLSCQIHVILFYCIKTRGTIHRQTLNSYIYIFN